MKIETYGWSVQYNIGKNPYIWPEAHRLRKDAVASFLELWTNQKEASLCIKEGRYKIVRVRIEVIS